MKRYYSLLACLLVSVVLLQHSYRHIPHEGDEQLKVTTWDAMGYYMYAPSMYIYHDYKELKWVPEIDAKYQLSGGIFYQALKDENGNYFYKYLGGVSLMQFPFFLAAHYMAPSLGYPQDGFSLPYQYAVVLAALFYAILGLFVLRRVLRYFFNDGIVTISLLLLCLATNFIQYAAYDSGSSHVYIFPLYALILYLSIKWHQKPTVLWAALIGYIIGLATICRPTEAVMLFIPLLWNTHNKEATKQKWQQVKDHKAHIAAVVIVGLIGILPQLLYWKSATGTWIYDVGSAWDFLTPHLRVLTGWEKGWFIYTPITIFFIVGLFFIKKYPFGKSVLWFCILNIYIIISWRDWHYGGSYSTRALMQSYPVFALAFAAFIDRIKHAKARWFFYAAGIYLIGVNLFQTEQYSRTIIHHTDMNRKYYSAIYLDSDPTPLDMSLMDTDEILKREKGYQIKALYKQSSPLVITTPEAQQQIFYQEQLQLNDAKDAWVKVTAAILTDHSLWDSYLNTELQKGDSIQHLYIRLFNPISKEGKQNQYEFHTRIPPYFYDGRLKVYLHRAKGGFEGTIEELEINLLEK